MVQLNNLEGFDMVFGVSEDTINHQLTLLSALEVLPAKWQVSKGPISMNASLGIPQINLNTGDASSRKAQLLLPLLDGTLTYVKIKMDDNGNYIIDENGNIETEKISLDVSGWTVTLMINLSLAEIAQNDVANHVAIPDEVKQQLSNFTDDMFSIQHLFLNFEDANLIDSYDIINSDAKLKEDVDFINTMKTLLKAFISGLQGSNNPFILGFAVNDKKAPDSNATFVPTGVTYSVFSDAGHLQRSSINYLLQTENKDIPGAGYGVFKNNWVNDDNIQGKFVVSETLYMNQILVQISNSLKTDVNNFQFTSPNSASLTIPNNDGGYTNCIICPNINSNQLCANFNYTFNKEAYDKCGSDIGYVDGSITWTSSILYTFDSDNKISISVNNSDKNVQSEIHPNFLGEFEKVLADIADVIISAITLGFVNDVFNNMINDDWSLNIDNNLSTALEGIKSRLILPGGSELFFKDISFFDDGSLTVSTTYKN